MAGITIQRTVYEPLEAGVYRCRVEDITSEAGQYGPQLKVRFALEEEGLEDRTLIGWCSCSFSPKSKLWAWTKVLLFNGKEIPDYFNELETDKLLGQRCQVVVTTQKGADGGEYNRIKDLLPLRTNGRAATQPTGAPVRQPTPAAQNNTGRTPVNAGDASDEPPGWIAADEDMAF